MLYHKIFRVSGTIAIVFIQFSFALGQTSSAEEKILLDIEKQRCESLNQKNSGTLNSIYHDQFRGVTASGAVVDKKELMEILKSTPPEGAFSTEDMKASIYGYAGVTSGKLIQKNKDGSIAVQSRFMNVYIKRNGKWLIVEGESTIIQP